MKMPARMALGLCLAVGASLTVACPPPVPPGVVYVRVAPPPPVPEVLLPAPGPEFVWVRGYHHWDGSTFVWVPGTWQKMPRPHAIWVPGHWRHTSHGWYWVDGRWK